MLSMTEAGDILNLVETSTVESLAADAWLGTDGTGGIALIGRRGLRRRRMYAAHELPALIVAASRLVPAPAASPAGTHDLDVVLEVEAIGAGADHEALTVRMRTIAAELRRWLADQEAAGGNRLDGLLESGDGSIMPGPTELVDDAREERTSLVRARIEATVRLRVAAA